MKIDKNKLYYTEDYLVGKLINKNTLNTTCEIKSKVLLKESVKEIIDILEKNVTEFGHRCISVYRHSFKTKNDTYNFCLSCGDYFKNDEFFYLSSEAKERLRVLLN